MDGTNSQTTAWPYPDQSEAAWSPSGPSLGDVKGSSVLGVPLHQSDQTLTLDQYLSRLADRVDWMIQQAGDPASVFRQIVEPKANGKADLRGVNPNRKHQSLGSQIVNAWEDLLRQHAGLNLVKFPASVRNQPDAVEAIKELDLEGWLDYLLPVEHD